MKSWNNVGNHLRSAMFHENAILTGSFHTLVEVQLVKNRQSNAKKSRVILLFK